MRPIRTFVVRASLALTFLLVCQLVFAASPAYVDNRVRDRVAAGETTRVIIQMGDQAHPKAYASSWRDRGPRGCRFGRHPDTIGSGGFGRAFEGFAVERALALELGARRAEGDAGGLDAGDALESARERWKAG